MSSVRRAVPIDAHLDSIAQDPDGFTEVAHPDEELDFDRLRGLVRGDIDVDLRLVGDPTTLDLDLIVYSCSRHMPLDDFMPILRSLGLLVVGQRTRELIRADGERCVVHWLRLRPLIAVPQSEADVARLLEAYEAIANGRADADHLNCLVQLAGLTWRQCAILRVYARYLQQLEFPVSASRVEEVLVGNALASAALVELFDSTFGPTAAQGASPPSANDVDRLVNDVLEFDADLVLSAIRDLMLATTRTNAYLDSDGPIAIKMSPQNVQLVREPRPVFEIFVHSPEVEGTHLRFGDVARGGIRWSDRPDDFRNEVLALSVAQTAKNAIIVPTGAKGGFVVRRAGGRTGAELRAEGLRCYRLYIQALLSITDNRDVTSSQVVGAPGIVRRDGDDPYLVVAADKGTATFSDEANVLATTRGFWLGDAFASGGSVGFDHKAMGITARGAWESVRRNFLDLTMNVDADPISVVGIGDMSGDVFGNGMLMTRSLRLVAAFDHRHIFLDPTPDLEASYVERQRLFDLAGSSWDDYDRGLISVGGGVWSRGAKSVTISAEARRALGIDDDCSALSPDQLIRAILCAPADLLWNGGVGTYVKSSSESHADVSDKSNNNVRVDAATLRVRCITEGGNLGVTAKGRQEFARCGGLIASDAADNSGGVNCSDREVNIKILLHGLVRTGRLEADDRNILLRSITPEVSALVVQDNFRRNALLSDSCRESSHMALVHSRMVDWLERSHGLDRGSAVLPDSNDFAEMALAGSGLTRPQLSTVISEVVRALKSEVDPASIDARRGRAALLSYFPRYLSECFGDRLLDQPLWREIARNQLVNAMVDSCGLTFAFRLVEETGVDTHDVIDAFECVDAIFGFRELIDRIRDSDVPAELQWDLIFEARRLIDRATRWLLTSRPVPLDFRTETARFAEIVSQLSPLVGSWLKGEERRTVARMTRRWSAAGVPPEVAKEVSEFLFRFSLLDIAEAAGNLGINPETVGETYFTMSHELQIDSHLVAVSALGHEDRWDSLARLGLREDLYRALRQVTDAALRLHVDGKSVTERVSLWTQLNAPRLNRLNRILDEAGSKHGPSIAALSSVVREIKGLTVRIHSHESEAVLWDAER